MNRLFLKPEDIMPGILLEKESGKLRFYGKSCPENAHEFYEPVHEWIDNYLKDPSEITIFECYLTYFNTLSAKIILKLMNKLENLEKKGKKVIIRWFYNESDELLKEAGEDFDTIVDVKFEFIALPGNEDENEDVESFLHMMDQVS